jgi:hypothetical protein
MFVSLPWQHCFFEDSLRTTEQVGAVGLSGCVNKKTKTAKFQGKYMFDQQLNMDF